MAQEYDRSSKWLIQHHGDSILRLAGIYDIESWRAVQTEVVQPRRLPDGLLEVHRANRESDELFLLELATYPERRIAEQMAEDMMLVWLDREVMPEAFVVVLHPKGRLPSPRELSVSSGAGHAAFTSRWSVVKLWELSAAELLQSDDVGIVPWIPLAKHRRDPAKIMQECRDRIDRLAPENERLNFLAVTQVLAGLRYNDDSLFQILGGERVMIESPVMDQFAARVAQRTILATLRGRFGETPDQVATLLESVKDQSVLEELAEVAGSSPDLATFENHLQQIAQQS